MRKDHIILIYVHLISQSSRSGSLTRWIRCCCVVCQSVIDPTLAQRQHLTWRHLGFYHENLRLIILKSSLTYINNES